MKALDKLQAFTPRRRAWWMVCVWLLASVCAIYLEESTSIFTYFERYFSQMRMASLGVAATDARGRGLRDWTRKHIVLLPLQDSAFGPEGEFHNFGTPPLPRSYHARLLRYLKLAGAKVVAFDFVFETPSPDDAALAQAAKEFGPVVWAAVPTQSASGAPALIKPVPALLDASLYIGHIQMPQAVEQPEISSLDLRAGVDKNGELLPAFAAVIAAAVTGTMAPETTPGEPFRIGSTTIPSDQSGRMPIIYFGKPSGGNTEEEAFSVMPYDAALKGDPEFDRPFFKDKIVIVGDMTKVNNDFRLTPAGYMAGMEIHANAVATLLRGLANPAEFVSTLSLPWRALLILFAAGLASWACAYAPMLRATLGVLVASVAYFFIATFIFTRWRLELPLLAPWFAVFLSTAMLVVHRGLVEERAKMEARRQLYRFLSPQVAEYVLNNPEKCALGGERVTATVLFSDIRDFTPLSEQLSGLEVVELLTEFLTEMTGKIIEHEGTLDKFIGDAIMAFWGAPVRHEDHAWRAVSTALDMAAALDELQDQWEARGLPRVEIGIGINSGDMVIGEMGAQARHGMPERKDFTAIGDAVNLASRVEGLNKTLSTRILITEATYRLVKYRVLVRGPFEAHVKGKRDAVMVYEPYARKPIEDAPASGAP